MSIKVELSTLDGVQVIDLAGRLDGASSNEFERAMAGTFAAPGQRALMDMAGLAYISSAGLRVILITAKRAAASRGRLILCGMQPNVRELFDMSGLFGILDVAPDRTAALAAIRG